MLGYLIDEEEFEVKPAISRVVQLFEVDTQVPKGLRAQTIPSNPDEFTYKLLYTSGNTSLIDDQVDYRVDLTFISSLNVLSYQVFINGDFYGENISPIQLNTGDILEVRITKNTSGESVIEFESKLV
jgi:hypothetical protein